jgi:SAM-dependent methyltransferase
LFKRLKFAWHCYNNPQQEASDIYQKYPPDHKFNGKKVLNLGCGTTAFPAPNVVNVDMFEVPGVDVVWDLSKTPLPFEDGEFDLVLANHVLEHIPNWWECFKEAARVVKIGGEVKVWLPGDGNSSQLGYRDHINMINHCSFVGIRHTWRNKANAWELNELNNTNMVKDLELSKNGVRMIDYWWCQLVPNSVLNWCAHHLRNTVSEQMWFFKKLPPMKEEDRGM